MPSLRSVLFGAMFAIPCLSACARSVPPSELGRSFPEYAPPERTAPTETEEKAETAVVVAPPLSAEELIAQAGADFGQDEQLRVASLNHEAAEEWFFRPPRSVYFYAERPLEVDRALVRGQCQGLRRWDSGVLNELALVVWQGAQARLVLALGHNVSLKDQIREDGDWRTVGARRLPMEAVAWDESHVRYAEGATLYEGACVPTVRSVPCDPDGPLLGPRGYCLDERMLVRPWRAPMVPHVGSIIPAYHDPVPHVPDGECAVRCEPSDCRAALQLATVPRVPVYEEEDAALAVFRTQAACRAFASARQGGGTTVGDCEEDANACW